MAAKKETPRRVARDARKPSSQGKSSGVGTIGWIVAGVLCLFAVIAGLLFATGKGASKNPEATRLMEEARASLMRNDFHQAIPKLQAARELEPDFPTTYFMLGIAFQSINELGQAKEAYKKCLELPNRGNKATCANNLGVIQMRANEYEDAVRTFNVALEVKGDWPQPHMNLGKLYWGMDNWEKAVHHYTEGWKLNPSDELWLHIATLLPKIYTTTENLHFHHKHYVDEVDKMWRRTDLKMNDPLSFETVFPYYLSYHGVNDVETYKKIADITRRGDPSLLYVAKHVRRAKKEGFLPAANRQPGDKIKVGFSSLYFKTHASCKMMRGVIENLDRNKYFVVVFALRERHDPPNPNKNDPFSMGVYHAADKYIDLPKNSLQYMRDVIEAEKLDVMVWAEIGMDPANYLLSFARLAPVTVATHGHASTSGVPSIDYYVTYRPFEIQNAQAHYNEKLVTMPGFSYYHWPRKPQAKYTRKELGFLPQYPHVYSCTQTLWKITPDFDEVFRQILLRDPQGQLVMKQYSPRGGDYLGRKLRERLKHTMPDVYDRVVILSALSDDKYLALLKEVDVVLDSYPFGGYTTSLECFGMGVPVVTIPHPMFAGRCTYGFYKLMNMTELIASTREEYVELALKMGNNATFNKEMRDKVEARKDVLFESKSAVDGWNEFLEQIATGKPVTYLHQDADPKEFEGEINGDWPAK